MHDLPTYEKVDTSPVRIVRKRGVDVIKDPLFNKGTAFPHAERERLGLRGLLPPRILSIAEQESRVLQDYYEGLDYVSPEEVENWHISSEMVRRWRVLQALQDRNETLFYRTLTQHITEMAPIIYTPTVGWVCTNYHLLYNKPRGMFISSKDKGEMASVIWNWPSNEVDAIVVTDGSRILGLGDLGLNGIGIPIGKLDLYVAAGGFHPERVLPVVIDVGTDNEALRNHPLYVGRRVPRLVGREYYEVLDEFVTAITHRYPDAVLQFEDFSIDKALPLLERYRYDHLVFNDDIQGTACTALAGIYGALRVKGQVPSNITQQRVVVLGAGSAGMGVTGMIAKGMMAHGFTAEQAASHFWVVDRDGLVTHHRERLPPHVQQFARRDKQSKEGEGLLEVVRRVKPTVLVGLSGAGRLFTEDVLRAMNEHCESAPIVMPMSNPTAKMECTAEEAQEHTGGRAIFASGSPQEPVVYDGRVIASSQANNMYIFPGLALGAFLGRTRTISDHMVMAAAEALPRMLTNDELRARAVYPDLANIRDISAMMAVEVIKAAAEDDMVRGPAAAKLGKGDDALLQWVKKHMYRPEYGSLVHLPVGVAE